MTQKISNDIIDSHSSSKQNAKLTNPNAEIYLNVDDLRQL